MNKINLPKKQYDYIRSLLVQDVEAIALDISFFKQISQTPKEFIDERISLCQEFDLDFWLCVSDNCSDYDTKQLQALYNNNNLKDFIENYEFPNEKELAENFLKMIVNNRNRKN